VIEVLWEDSGGCFKEREFVAVSIGRELLF